MNYLQKGGSYFVMIDNNACPVCNDLIDVYEDIPTAFKSYNFSGIFNIAHLNGSGTFEN